MNKYFNTAGPVNQQEHYRIEPLERFDLEEVLMLIEQKKYFVLHAPRQTGKTSSMLALMDHLNSTGKYIALYCNIETLQTARNDIDKASKAMLFELSQRAKIHLNDNTIEIIVKNKLDQTDGNVAFKSLLHQWTKNSSLPIVLIIDEIDSVVGDTLISILRQIRSGYDTRPDNFPQSIILCGVRDVRDYRIRNNNTNEIITGGSAFNIKAESLTIGNFSREEIVKLYAMHTKYTGQKFDPQCFDLIWLYTDGQPYLVNSLGYEVTFKMKENRDRNRTITPEMIKAAKENLILRRETHIDQLFDKLKEERVSRVIRPILVGKERADNLIEDDVNYVMDLGLIKQKSGNELIISNEIYKEVIPRELSNIIQQGLSIRQEWYLNKDKSINFSKLLSDFQQFYRKNSGHWSQIKEYEEAGPQLLLQAYLQRIVNGGGSVNLEYGLGRLRTDLHISMPYENGIQETVIELKIQYGSRGETVKKGLKQLTEYMDTCGALEGHLIIINRDNDKLWKEKIFREIKNVHLYRIHVWGM